jgi:hypothetical protein
MSTQAQNSVEQVISEKADEHGLSFGKSFGAFSGSFTLRRGALDNGQHVGIEVTSRVATIELRGRGKVQQRVRVDLDADTTLLRGLRTTLDRYIEKIA